MRMIMTWWQEFQSRSNKKVDTSNIMAIIMMTITALILLLAIILICYHCFYHGKGIDSETVKLIGILLGGGALTGGAGTYFTRTTSDYISSRTNVGKARPKPSPERD